MNPSLIFIYILEHAICIAGHKMNEEFNGFYHLCTVHSEIIFQQLLYSIHSINKKTLENLRKFKSGSKAQ